MQPSSKVPPIGLGSARVSQGGGVTIETTPLTSQRTREEILESEKTPMTQMMNQFTQGLSKAKKEENEFNLQARIRKSLKKQVTVFNGIEENPDIKFLKPIHKDALPEASKKTETDMCDSKTGQRNSTFFEVSLTCASLP